MHHALYQEPLREEEGQTQEETGASLFVSLVRLKIMLKDANNIIPRSLVY